MARNWVNSCWSRSQEWRLNVVERRCQARLALGRHQAVVEALSAYGRVRRRLLDDLGVEPGRQLRAELLGEDKLGQVLIP